MPATASFAMEGGTVLTTPEQKLIYQALLNPSQKSPYRIIYCDKP